MAKEKLPPACAFAVSVLTEYSLNPEEVPEEAVEAAEQHVTTCVRCLSNTSIDTTTLAGKKKKARQAVESEDASKADGQTSLREPVPFTTVQMVHTPQRSSAPAATAPAAVVSDASPLPPSQSPPQPPSRAIAPVSSPSQAAADGPIDCQQCRQVLPEYAEAMDGGQNVAFLYPEVQEHLL